MSSSLRPLPRGRQHRRSGELFRLQADTRVGGDEARFVRSSITAAVDLHAFTLADPYRVVVDLPQVMFRLPPKTGEGGRGLINGVSLRPGDAGRLAHGVRRHQAGAHRQGLRRRRCGRCRRRASCSISPRPIARASLRAAIALDNRVARSEPPPASTAGARKGDPRPLVVLDPGHGGIDNGTMAASGELEKDIVLDFAQRLRDRSRRPANTACCMTRTDDTFVPLVDRVRIARNAGAALFVSIHADALPHGEGDAQGATSTRCPKPPRIRRRRGLPRTRTGPTSSPASISRPSRTTSPTS